LLLALLLMKDLELLPLLLACPILYAGALLGLRIISLNDVKLLQDLR